MVVTWKSEIDISLEALQYQQDRSFVEDATKLLDSIGQSLRQNRSKFENHGGMTLNRRIKSIVGHQLKTLEKLLYKRIGIYFRIEPDTSSAAFISTIFPPLDNQDISSLREDILEIIDEVDEYRKRNKDPSIIRHLEEIYGWVYHMNDLYKAIAKKPIKIDYKHARIENWPVTLKPRIGINFLFWFIRNQYTSRELLAVMLHEIGHQFRAIEALVTTIKINSLLIKAAQSHLRGNDKAIDEVKLQIIETIDDKEVRKVIESNDEYLVWGYQTYYYHISRLANITKNPETTMRSFEKEADNFSVMFGLGAELATALERFGGSFGRMLITSTVIFIIEAAKTAFIATLVLITKIPRMLFSGLVIFTIVFIGILLIETFSTDLDAEDSPHPKLSRRLFYIKKQLVEALKTTPSLTDEEKQYLIEQFTVVTELVEKTKGYNVNLFNKVGGLINPFKWSADKTFRLNDVLEELSRPDTYVYAQLLRD